MKRVLFAIAVAALGFVACQKEQPAVDEAKQNLVTVSFTAEKVVGTKTAVDSEGADEITYKWVDADIQNIRLFTVTTSIDSETGKVSEVVSRVSTPTITKVSDTKLTISAQVEANATYTFRAILSGKWTNAGLPRLSESQSPLENNIDPTADLLITDDMEVVVGDSETSSGDMEMLFRRFAVVNKMTLKNLAGGEKIDRVVISSEKNLAGYVNSQREINGDKTSMTLNYNKAFTVPANGQFPVYFTTLPETGQSLTVEVYTDQNTYTKSFVAGRTIDFIQGEFTKFNFALPAGVANNSLTLPIEDSMEWAITETGQDDSQSLSAAEIPVTKDEKKVYSEAAYVYKGASGLKMGSSSYRGVLTTSELDLSSAFYIEVSAKAWANSSGALDASQVEFLVDGESVFTSADLSSDYKTYVYNASAATAKSKVAIKIDGKRGYIKDFRIKTGAVVLPPVIKVTSDNPLSVDGTAGTGIINYAITNPTEATLTAIKKDVTVTWISNIDCSTSGEVTFDVAAQEAGAPARSAVLVLSYAGAEDVEVTVNQAKGTGSISVNKWSYTFTSNPWGDISGDVDLVSGETAISWNLDAQYAAYNNNLLALSTGNNKAAASITSNDDISNVSKVVVNAKTNSTCEVKLTVKVGDTILGTKTLTNVTSLTDYVFTSSTPVSGKISINFTDPTNGYQIKRIDINPAAASVTGISVEDYTASFTASESGSYSFDGKVYAVYSDNAKVELTAGEYSVSGNVNLASAGTYPLTVSATIGGTEFSKEITITVNPAGGMDYTYVFTSKQFTEPGTKILNNVSWSLSGSPNYYGYDERGQQFGSKNNPADNAILSTSDFTGTISSVKVNAAAYSSNATIEVSVNGVSWGSKNLSNTNSEYEFTGSTPSTGEVIITLTNPSSGGRALYIKKIVVN